MLFFFTSDTLNFIAENVLLVKNSHTFLKYSNIELKAYELKAYVIYVVIHLNY